MQRPMPHLVALLGAALLAAAPAALAQTQAPRTQAPQNQAPMPAPSQPAPQISDQKLDAAAAATMQVASLSRQYREQLSAAPPNEKQRIVDEANTKIEKAITDQGLSLQEYNSIMEEARANPEVHQKILDRLPKTN